MSKFFVVTLIFLFLVASCLIVSKPVSGASATGDTWVEKAPMHVARGGLGVVTVDNKIYAIGGETVTVSKLQIISGEVVGTNEQYNPVTNTWSVKASMPTPRYDFAIAVYQNKIYCLGGDIGNGTATGTNEVYDPVTDTWATKSPMPTARLWLQANVMDGKIYLIGGQSQDGSLLQLNEVYDPANDTWATKASMPSGTSHYASAIVNNKIYVIGGFNTENKNQIYDPQTDNWSSGASPPNALVGVGAATMGVKAPLGIYVFSESDETQFYNTLTNTWIVGAGIPTHRVKFGVATANDVIYVVGGVVESYPYPAEGEYVDETPSAITEEYTPFGYGTVPPVISVVSPENGTYASSEVSLNFSANQPVGWVGYSLDGKSNITVTGNTTLSGLSNGLHNITVYANDTFGNVGTSETVSFTVAKLEPFPTVTVAAAASLVAVVIVGVALGVYLKRRRRL